MVRLRSLVVLLAAISGRVSAAIGPIANLTVANAVVAPDGFPRVATIPNGGVPGPLIRGNKGDTFSINVINELTNGSLDLVTAVHWHGIVQKKTNWADGGAFVNQCPIVPSHNFTYTFNTTEQAGTYWYHSHYKAQYCDGLRGPLVIYDPRDPQRHLYDVDNEDTVITLADWYHTLSPKVLIPNPNSTLINGKGRYLHGPPTDLAVVKVTKGQRYRLRLVSISCDPNFTFSIDGHNMTVIEVDGGNVQPMVVDLLQIFAGQRYSVVLDASRPVDNYWIRAMPNTGNTGFTDSTNLAVLHYLGAPIGVPTVNAARTIPTSVRPFNLTDVHPLVRTPVPGRPIPGGADINIKLVADLNLSTFLFEVNNVTFKDPKDPVLLQILNGVPPSQLLPNGSIYPVGKNMSVEVSLPALPSALGGPHPIHMHGHPFHVVRGRGVSTYNYVDPVIRDVVSMGSDGDNVTIRFVTDSPGPWFLHCHIDWHLGKGFAVVFAEDTGDVSTTDTPPPRWRDLCPTYNGFVNVTG